MNRIEKTFKNLKKQKRAALVSYIMAYDPDLKTSQSIFAALPKAGVDIIELGMPFSDPMAEGPTIQAAAARALKSGAKMKGVLSMVKDFRKKEKDTPIILMGYYNPILHYGVEKFVKEALAAGADGCIIVDLPVEEEEEFTHYAYKEGLAFIKLSAPTTNQERAKKIYRGAKGFAYYVSVTGVTGTKTPDFSGVKKQLKVIRQGTKLPIAVGFGIRTPQQAAEVAKFADAVVVGSAFVKIIAENLKNKAKALKDISKFANQLSKAIKN